MTWTAPEVARVDELWSAPEREALESWLAWHRSTLLVKCQGLTGPQLCERAVPPSTLSLLGLVRHMTFVERIWFRIRFARQDLEPLFGKEQDPDADFNGADPERAAQDFAAYQAECALADEAARGHSLDETFMLRGGTLDLRWIYLHMIEEYARHNGHADLLRERIDGVTGYLRPAGRCPHSHLCARSTGDAPTPTSAPECAFGQTLFDPSAHPARYGSRGDARPFPTAAPSCRCWR